MITERIVKIAIYILIFIVAAPIALVYFYALETGVDADLTTIVYVAGLLAGMMLVLFYNVLLIRRSNRNRVGGDYNGVDSTSGNISRSLKRVIVALAIIAIILFLIYPIRFYAPQEKALFVPLVYWAGVILGTSLAWIVVRPESTQIVE